MKRKLISFVWGLTMLVGMFVCSSLTVNAEAYTSKAARVWNGHTYQLYDEGMTWSEAKQYCESMGGHLVTITSEEEQKIVEQLLYRGLKKQYWLGLSGSSRSMSWVTGEELKYTNWDNGQPDSSTKPGQREQYVHIYNSPNPAVSGSQRFKWNDMFNDNTFPREEDFFSLGQVGFICEWEEKLPVNPFADVAASKYYYKPIIWAYNNEITAGVTPSEFEPGTSCTRGQVVTFLWRTMGKPEPGMTTCPFIDISPNAYYYKAVLWAYENGVTEGVTPTEFRPDDTITRAQAVTFLYRNQNKPAYSVKNPFMDVAPNAYYYKAVLWAYENEVTAGITATKFAPDDFCSRGQVVTFLYRALD